MLIGELSSHELARRLRGTGIYLGTGAITTHVRLDDPRLIEEFAQTYGHYSSGEPQAIADARVRVAPTSPWRRYFRRQIQAYVNDWTPFEPHAARLAFPLMESGLNWCVAMSDTRHLILHAAVVERDGIAVVLPGPSGSGKSTLCAALTLHGWRLLSDEFTIINADDGRVMPNPRPISLKNRSIALVTALSAQARVGPSYPGTAKGTVAYMRPPDESVERAYETARPGLVVSVRHAADGPLGLERMEKAQGFMWLAENAVNYLHTLRTGFETLATLVDACPIHKLSYTDLDGTLELIGQLHGELSRAGEAA